MSAKRLLTFLLCFPLLSVLGQSYLSNTRLDLDTALYPFYHGVASGDPTANQVVIWTRITEQGNGPFTVNWAVATDTSMANVVKSGSVQALEENDFTVKALVQDLTPNTFYYYQFSWNGNYSLTGRTKTAPVGNVDRVRMAVVSCADFQNGYYNAYQHIANRNDIDVVLHLGDYIYEYAASSNIPGRQSPPANEIITLSDYRVRHSHYRLDPQLRALHQQYPFITVWDDHESANNSWRFGAQNHTEGAEGTWADRLNHSVRAYFEWLPIIAPDPNDDLRIYRSFNYGNLIKLVMLDTRIIGRSQQGGNANDPNRSLLGTDQFDWLKQQLLEPGFQWKVLGQQVMMAPLTAFGAVLNNDQWDGYNFERQQLYNHILQNNIQNFVVLTGDIHTHWANDLPGQNYNASTGAGSVGVEFVCASITSSNSSVNLPTNVVTLANPHVKFVDLVNHGYYILDVTSTRAHADFFNVATIDSIDTAASRAASFFVNQGERFLRSASSEASPPFVNSAPLAPLQVKIPVGVPAKEKEIILIGTYPNPFDDQITIQYHVFDADPVMVKVWNMQGKRVYRKTIYHSTPGVNYAQIELTDLPAGVYQLELMVKGFTYQKQILKR